jgi:NADPH:quinone reductase-like Zn-dependent oxidoreductase
VRGSRVFATAGSAEKCAACRALGAEIAVNYREDDFVEQVIAATDGRGVDVILDMVGGDYIARNVKALALEGRLVMIAFLAGPKAELNFAQVMSKRLTLTGSTLRPQSVEAKARIAADLSREVWPLLDTGRIAPVMDRTFALEDAASAHARMESSAHIGKIVLTVA